MQENEQLTPEELQVPNLITESEVEIEGNIMEGVDEELQKALDAQDLNKKNYVKITPTFYIQSVETKIDEEPELDDEGNPIELFKILNPETGIVEVRELTDEEKREILIKQLKDSHVRFKPIKHDGKVTTNQFGAAYKKKRQRRNKLAKASRKNNR
jgi:hypothetical protein